LGDIFFVLVNISRFVGVNAEEALRKTISKFISRFRYIEMTAAEEAAASDMTSKRWTPSGTKQRKAKKQTGVA